MHAPALRLTPCVIWGPHVCTVAVSAGIAIDADGGGEGGGGGDGNVGGLGKHPAALLLETMRRLPSESSCTLARP